MTEKQPARTYRKLMLTLVASVNLLVAVLLVEEAREFRYNLDRPGLIQMVGEDKKLRMLRLIHYWGIPPVALLAAVSGILLWQTARKSSA